MLTSIVLGYLIFLVVPCQYVPNTLYGAFYTDARGLWQFTCKRLARLNTPTAEFSGGQCFATIVPENTGKH